MVLFIPFKTIRAYLICMVLLAILTFGRIVNIRHYQDGSFLVTLISFLPLYTELTPDRLIVSGTDSRQFLKIQYCYSGFFKVGVRIRERNYPKGYPVVFRLKRLPTWIPGISRSLRITIFPRVKPEILHGPPKIAGTQQPLAITFTTPLRSKGIERWITANFPMKLTPRKYLRKNRLFIDNASWLITPCQQLKRRASYQITLRPELTAITGKTLGYRRIFRFTTVSRLRVTAIRPRPESYGVSLFPSIQVEADRILKKGKITVPGYSGETSVQEKIVSFTPSRILLPDSRYRVIAIVTDVFGEKADAAWNFYTQKLATPFWLEVNLRVPQRITVYQGKKVLRVMKASGGGPETPTPCGFFRIGSRGYAFYSPKWREGGYFWLQFSGNLAIHSVRFGPDYRLKPAEITKLGKPATHGSIAVSMEDIRWFYRNLPKGTPVVVHGLSGQNPKKTADGFEDSVFFSYSSEFEHFKRTVK
jgi:hypothetical protein